MNLNIKNMWRYVKRIQAIESVVRMGCLLYSKAIGIYEWLGGLPWQE